MNKARRELAEMLPQVDMVIELLDARIPFSSGNPLLRELRGDKPFLTLLNKADLADPELVAVWVTELNALGLNPLPIHKEQTAQVMGLVERCLALCPQKTKRNEEVLALITGIPNIGKSTLINKLAGRKVARSSDKPAITRHMQRVDLKNGLVLFDTPGMLWPKFENPMGGYRLAMTGAVGDTAIDYEDVALHNAEYLVDHYRPALQERFPKLEDEDHWETLLQRVGQSRGFMRAGGIVDPQRAAKALVHEYRQGLLGATCLETPSMIETELEEARRLQAEKEMKKAARKKKKRRR